MDIVEIVIILSIILFFTLLFLLVGSIWLRK